MSLMDGMDMVGYVLGAGMLAADGVAQWRGKLKPARENVWFAIAGAVLLAMSLSMPGGDNRLLAYIGLWGAWLLGQMAWPQRATDVLCWAVRLMMFFVMADTVWHLGRPGWINPNIEGAILVLGLTFVGNVRWAGLWVIALICTGSRGAMVALGLPLAWTNRAVLARHRWLLMALALGAVLILAWRPGTITARLDHWAEALRLFAASPIVGWGPGNYIHVSTIPWQNHADNALLTVLAEQGLVGLLALIPLGIVVARRWRSANPLTQLVLMATALHNLVDDTWLQPWPALLLGLNLALLWRPNEVVETTLAGVDPAAGGADTTAPALGPTLE
jgi:O-antigen ligase